MIRSMTGFGRGKAESADLRVQIDLRSVNHRFLDLRFRLPFFSPELEESLKGQVAAVLHRGKVDLILQVEEKGDRGSHLRVNRSLLKDYLELLESIRTDLNLAGSASLDHIAMLPWGKVFEVEEMEMDEGRIAVFREAMQEALGQMVDMREREGRSLREDLLGNLEALSAVVLEIQENSGDLVELYRDKLRERIRSLLQDREPDEERLLQEAAFLADRSDISEEVTRLQTHMEEIRDTLGQRASVGKKLDFLMQECHREVNTIGSKTKGADVSRQVVEAKSRVEAMREQVQNIE